MLWFKSKPSIAVDSVANKAAIEIVAHKNAKQEAVQEVKAANQQLNKLLVENGFTLKIYLAAGGRHPNAHTEGS